MCAKPILFVDDNVWCHLENCEYLRASGFRVVDAYNAPEAIHVLDEHGALLALVTDIDLGEEVDGFEIARRARKDNPRLPVIYISGTAAARHGDEGVPRSEFILKPFAPERITEALCRVICLDAA